MSKTVLNYALLFVVLVLAQALIFNHIALFGVALAFVFIYFIIKLPVDLSPSKVMLLSFAIGLTVDIFEDTPGMNALTCTCLGGCRRPILGLYLTRDDQILRAVPSIKSFGLTVFAKYVFTFTLLYCLMFFTIESFTFFNFKALIVRALASTLLTSVLLTAIDCIALSPHNEKRL